MFACKIGKLPLRNTFRFVTFLILLVPVLSYAQIGITIAPNKLYYNFPYGSTGTQKIIVQNPNDKDIEVGVSIADWEYDSIGSNVTYDVGALKTSCAEWIRINPGTYFVLKPYERKEVEITLLAPSDADPATPVHTAMLYFTQLNPGTLPGDAQGANVSVTVKMGAKIYHTYVGAPKKDIDITDFRYLYNESDSSNQLKLQIDNMGNSWVDGKVKVEVLNTESGKKYKLNDADFYQLPGDKRVVVMTLPEKIQSGRYNATAIVSYGDKDELKVADLDFEIVE